MMQDPTRQDGIRQLTEHLFRQESGKLTAAVVGILGMRHFQLAEDAVQEALARALETWPFYGTPQNPAAWLMQTAKNRAIDIIRREQRFHDKLPEVTAAMTQPSEIDKTEHEDDEISDDCLRLIFVCCHPLLSAEDQITLALKTLCGFSGDEISHAFLSTPAAIAKRLTRVKQYIRNENIPFEVPEANHLTKRLNGVLHTLYLLFSEGYKTSSGDSIIRDDLCHEAIRLTKLLIAYPTTSQPRVHALIALMYFNTARLKGRESVKGALLRLHEQDRSSWDKGMIAHGIFHLSQSAVGNEISEYHLQAGIAACHCTAASNATTDWPAILKYYDHWSAINPSALVMLNRAVALSHVQGVQAALNAIAPLRTNRKMNRYHLLHAFIGDLEEKAGSFSKAAEHFKKACELAEVSTEKAFLLKRHEQNNKNSRHEAVSID
jgi:RNA polymerase sigma factor (sigma-70 family)